MERIFESSILFGERVLSAIHIPGGAWMDAFMAAVTYLGEEMFYQICIPILFWCVNRDLGFKIGGAFIISAIANDLLKELFSHPRPDPLKLAGDVQELSIRYRDDAPGFPSGHAQNAVVFWGTCLFLYRKRIAAIVCIALILLISYSRLYLGVHYLGDVIGGLIIGMLLLLAYIGSLSLFARNDERRNKILPLFLGLVIPLLLFIALPGTYMPKTCGVMSGFLAGIIIAEGSISFCPRNSFLANMAKLCIGMTGILAIRIGLKAALPAAPAADYIRYWVIGFWITLIAPLIFSRFDSLRGDTGKPESAV